MGREEREKGGQSTRTCLRGEREMVEDRRVYLAGG